MYQAGLPLPLRNFFIIPCIKMLETTLLVPRILRSSWGYLRVILGLSWGFELKINLRIP
jgi:hypothetical protein